MSAAAAAEISPRRAALGSLWFNIFLGFFVIVCSFTYGLVHGLSKQATEASAARSPLDLYPALSVSDEVNWPKQFPMPGGIQVVPMGDRIAINGRRAHVVSFFTNRSVRDVMSEQMDLWLESGLKAFAAKGKARGTAIAFDPLTKRRLTMTAWLVPPHLREKIAAGHSVQGIVAIHHGTEEVMAEPEESFGEIPGVPVMEGSQKGAVFSSTDRGGRSYTAVYTNPGPVSQSIAFYTETMQSLGWDLRTPVHLSPKIRTATFLRGQDEATLLFAPVLGNGDGEEEETVVTVIVAPRFEHIPGGLG